ncbi:hypothetical protein PMIN03_006535 [Paraphaeosphaeria minitans]
MGGRKPEPAVPAPAVAVEGEPTTCSSTGKRKRADTVHCAETNMDAPNPSVIAKGSEPQPRGSATPPPKNGLKAESDVPDVFMGADDAQSGGSVTPGTSAKDEAQKAEVPEMAPSTKDATSDGSVTPRATAKDKAKLKKTSSTYVPAKMSSIPANPSSAPAKQSSSPTKPSYAPAKSSSAPTARMSLWAGPVYIHFGDHEAIPDYAPPAMQFLKSYLPIAEGPQSDVAAAHHHPAAMRKVNDDPPQRVNSFNSKLQMQEQLPIQYESNLFRAWAIPNTGEPTRGVPRQTVLMD